MLSKNLMSSDDFLRVLLTLSLVSVSPPLPPGTSTLESCLRHRQIRIINDVSKQGWFRFFCFYLSLSLISCSYLASTIENKITQQFRDEDGSKKLRNSKVENFFLSNVACLVFSFYLRIKIITASFYLINDSQPATPE